MRPDGHLGGNTMNLTVIADFEDNGAKSATRPPCPSHCLWRIVWRRSLLNLCPPPTPNVHHWTCDTVCIVSLCVPVVL